MNSVFFPEDSILKLESLVLNSYDRGSNITIDMSGLTDLPELGTRGMGHIAEKLEDSGSSVTIIGAQGAVSKKLKHSGIIKDQ